MTITGEKISESSQAEAKEKYFTRFSVRQRIEHAVLMVSFIVLSVTGLAQRYYTTGWGEWVILGLGGIEYTRLIHRIFGLVFTLSIIYHFSYVAYLFFVKHRRLTMVPTIQDFHDVVGALRHGFGFADKPPLLGRFDYRQKFEYWGLILGGLVITVTGFILAFPVAVTRVVPGQVVAAAVEFHGYEATLAVLVIIIWHLYDVILRPGVFPADMTIFTGKISRERMLEEHPMEYAELQTIRPGSGADNLPSGEGTADPANESQ
ncbi:MAG: cytochrome b/b6 domain-containing protein [Dehalococcoidales bacterium]|nr:cytochrome b/b6 domain-containing protein [Dehalococcoidales bacterium]